MRVELPSTLEDAKDMTKDYQHTKKELTKAILTTKLKNICTKYRKGAGRKSGQGRVVLILYESCEKIWAGSPATTQIQGGEESTDLVEGTQELSIQQNSHAQTRHHLTQFQTSLYRYGSK